MVFPLPKEIFHLPKSLVSSKDMMEVFDVEETLELQEPIVMPSTGATFSMEDEGEVARMVPIILKERQL